MNQKEICKKHGETTIWIACKHVGEGTADTVIFSENQDALCFDCANNFKDLTEQDVVGMCEGCLKDFTAKLMISAQTFANLKDRVIGVEHLRGRWSEKGKK